METEDLKNLVKSIVEKATTLKNKHIEYKNTPVNYACIFSQNKEEYDELLEVSTMYLDQSSTDLFDSLIPKFIF